jgi:hypothetical protein
MMRATVSDQHWERIRDHFPEVQKAEALASRQLCPIGSVLVHLHFEFAEFLAKSLLHRLS